MSKDVSRNDKRREWWIDTGFTRHEAIPDAVVKSHYQTVLPSSFIHVREVLPGDEGKRLFSREEILDALRQEIEDIFRNRAFAECSDAEKVEAYVLKLEEEIRDLLRIIIDRKDDEDDYP